MTTKKRVLTLLEACRGQHISGEDMAEQLGVSRNAVWKAIAKLKDEGYTISSVPKKGYCLCADSDIISVQGMLPYLKKRDAEYDIFVHESLASTNQTAKLMALDGAEHGTVILANHQTAGKGRYDRAFHSPPGGIYMSVILHPGRVGFSVVKRFAAS
jgi:BirA family biotin operon repressor/biotin-[acetyl-CoA-carboxylase] ligase